MEKQESAPALRVSERVTKGVPPQRYGVSVAVTSAKKTSKKSTSSKASSKARREAEAARDEEIANLKSNYADMVKKKTLLEINIKQLKKRLEKLKSREGDEAASPDRKEVTDIEEEIENLENELELLNPEVDAIESTYAEKIAAIRSRCEAILEQSDEGASLSLSEDDENDTIQRVENWAATSNQMAVVAEHTTKPRAIAPSLLHCAHSPPPPSTTYFQPTTTDFNILRRPEISQHQARKQPVTFQPVPSDLQSQHSIWDRQFQHSPPNGNDGRKQYYEREQRQCAPSVISGSYSPEPYQRQEADLQRVPDLSKTSPDNRQGDNEVVSQLVAALGKAFGKESKEVIVKSAIDKKLPTFDGNPADWENYRSEYQRTTQKYNYGDSENSTRIRSSLSGDALSAVKHLLANPKNIAKIWEVLKKRFGRAEFVLDYLVEKAKATKSPDTAKPETMVEFGTAIDALVTNICAYNEYDYMCNRQLVNEFVGKLPVLLRSQWHEWLLEDEKRKPNLNYFSSWLTRKVDAAILAIKPKVSSESKDDESKRGRQRARGSVNISTANSEEHDKAKCPCCSKTNHTLAKCWKFQKLGTNDKWKIAKEGKLCISCFGEGHRSRNCPDAKQCSVDGCERWHNVLLHTSSRAEKTKVKSGSDDGQHSHDSSKDKASSSPTTGSTNAAIIEGLDGPLQIIPVKLRKQNGTGFVRTFALLDGGATRSLMLKSLAEDLGLKGDAKTYSYSGINGQKVTVENAMQVNCKAAGDFPGSKYRAVINCITVDEIKIGKYSFNLEEAKKTWPHLKTVRGQDLVSVVPSLIILNNNPELLIPNRVVRGNPGDPVGLRTTLGWTVSGNFDIMPGHGNVSATACGEEATDEFLHGLMKSWFTTENFGVKPQALKGASLEDKRALKILEETTRKTGERWEVGLLWRQDDVVFPNSERDAAIRLSYTEKKMKDPNFKEKYTDKITEYLKKGYMKKLTPEEANVRPPHTRYIPHFGLINPNKPDKFRFILDAKAKSGGVSLNDMLLKGPDLIRPLTSVIMNFRKYQVALTGDITDMFHRILIREEDKPSQRLLWRDGDISKAIDHYQMEVMMFGATSSPASAIYVKNRNAEEFKEKYPVAADIIVKDFYVDDCLTGGDTVEEVIEIRRQISEIHDSGGFRVCKFMSNSPEVLASIPEDVKQVGVKGLKEKDEIPGERVLGLWWNPGTDYFTFKLSLHKVRSHVLDGAIPTKREMCSLIMSLYDPLGFVSQYKVKGLMILQDVWKSGSGWDDPISSEINIRWQSWIMNLNDITNVRIPRCLSSLLPNADSVQLHTFQDASEESYSAVCYLRIQAGERVEVAPILSKARVAPLKKLTIPKLELQAALLGTRLAVTITEELRVPISSRWFWSDSKTVLSWIRSTGVRFKEFVANRVGEIQEATNAADWHWVPTRLNVADQATRFESVISFHPDSAWYTGPDFLKLDPCDFPKEPNNDGSAATLFGKSGDDEDTQNDHGELQKLQVFVPDPGRFSTYIRLQRATAAVRRSATFWKGKVKRELSQHPWGNKHSNINAEDLEKARNDLIRYAQAESYTKEIQQCRAGNQVSKKSHIWKLCPKLDATGVLRLDGRIRAAHVPEEVRFPAILPPKHRITELIVDFEHVKFAHQGMETVLASLRQHYWIPEGRAVIRRAKARCQVCHLRRAKPIVPKMGNLPSSRLASFQPPFTFTGLDFFGPMFTTVGRRHEKRWGALFCCQVTRAVHLEVCHGLSTDEVMMAISRFADVRGRPHTITSDNGTNFVGAAAEMGKNLKEVEFENIMAMGKFQEIKWVFNPPAAPHMGGSWERLVQTVKKCLSCVLREKYPKDTTLITMMKSVENMVNSRPLTHLSSDPADPQPITPNHFLRGSSDAGPGIPAKMDPDVDFLKAQWRRAQLLADQFWVKWTREFLPKLLRREKWHEEVEPIQVGELVYMVDEQQPRNSWVRGYISAVFPGADGQVRVVEVTTKDPNGRKVIYKRPVAKVSPLGLKIKIQDSNES